MYNDPLVNRYATKEIVNNFSDEKRYVTWRKIWLELAKAQKKLGLTITDAQIQQMEANLENIDFQEVAKLEKELHHDLMAHLHAFGKQAPLAKPIIHLGATSETVKDNADLILIKDALDIIKPKLLQLLQALAKFANEYKDTATIGFTHLQVAQPTTVGKRACGWLQSFVNDFEDLTYFLENNLKFRGLKGATGTQASFKGLFNGNYEKVKELNNLLTEAFGFQDSFIITGQTYDRKLDVTLLNILANIGVSAHKITNDIRILQHLKEIEEDFVKKQVGSSAMPYKRNPIRSERVSSLAKYVMALPVSSYMVAATQWLERTLDDSANRRIIIPNAFFAVDAILQLLLNIVSNLNVNTKVIAKNIEKEIPFLATENIMMLAVTAGGDRQQLHEKIRKMAMETKQEMIESDAANTLLEKILKDKEFNLTKEKLQTVLHIEDFIGFAKEQVEDYLQSIASILK
ncbi:Adenylosuccinate lyase [Candidatus Hepatincola sp. Pdp]